MGSFGGFPLLFLLPLILGCFLSPSKAEPLPYEEHKVEFENEDPQTHTEFRTAPPRGDLVPEAPELQSRFRSMPEPAEFVTGLPQVKSSYRSMPESSGSATRFPLTGAKFRTLQEQAAFENRFSQTQFREAEEHEPVLNGVSQTQYGFRSGRANFKRTFLSGVMSIFDAIATEIQDESRWNRAREFVYKVTQSIRQGLDKISTLPIFD